MCTINMTFEVPESKHIDIEALKRQINAFYHIIISTPSIVMPEKSKKKRYDMSVFDSLSNNWNIDEEDLRKARKSDWAVEPW